jgi:hypothetical protein
MPTLQDHANPFEALEELREHPAVRKVHLVEDTFDEPVYFKVWLTEDAASTSALSMLLDEHELSIGQAMITERGYLKVNLGYDG